MADETLRARVAALANEAQRRIDEINATPDPLTGRHSTMAAFVLVDQLRALLDAPDPGRRGGAMSERTELTGRIEEILRVRAYDEHAYDEDLFGELLDEIDDAVRGATTNTKDTP